MKLCIDCKHKKGFNCESPHNTSGVDPVNGGNREGWLVQCASHRTGAFTDRVFCRLYKLCGKEGRWFEPINQNGHKDGAK